MSTSEFTTGIEYPHPWLYVERLDNMLSRQVLYGHIPRIEPR